MFNCSLCAPSLHKPIEYTVSWNIIQFCPFSDTHCFTITCKKSIQRIVSILLTPCRPFAIRWRIPFFIIDSLNSMFCRWLFSHIRNKGFKTIKPSFTYFNVLIFLMSFIRVKTSSLHRYPASIFRGERHPMNYLKFTCDFILFS